MSCINEIVTRLRESSDPNKGIFWFVKKDEDDELHILYLDIPIDSEFVGNSKNGLTYTHEKTWEDLASDEPSEIRNKEWNYFPRGRVEIRNNKATIYLNPHINIPMYQESIIKAFNLQRIPHRFVSDGSSHYHSIMLD